jgi:hypothetical protein
MSKSDLENLNSTLSGSKTIEISIIWFEGCGV